MSTIYIGSARIDENGKASGGKDGDQKQTTTPDYSGEVSLQKMYAHTKTWLVARPKDVEVAESLASNMKTACNNPNVGYNQNNRFAIMLDDVNSKKATAADCGTLVRRCIKNASGKDVGNFTTATEKTALEKSGLFETPFEYVSQKETPVYNGDVLFTKTKGHTAIVVSGNPRKKSDEKKYYPKYTGNSTNLDVMLKTIGVPDKYIGSWTARKPIATACGISDYVGSTEQNVKLKQLAKNGQIPII